MQQPENQSKTYSALFADIDSGKIKIPQFQRDFVWGKAKTAALIDSILKGFPIGTFILWKTRDRLRHMRNVGNFDLKEPAAGDAIQYVLDGQQRITSLYAVRKGARFTRDGTEEIDYKDIVIDLTADPDEEEEVVLDTPLEDRECIPVYHLLNASIKQLVSEHGQSINRVSDYKEKLERYHFSTVVIDEYPIEVACEVFTRINTGGEPLNLFEIMVAKTFDQERNFDLAERYRELVSSETDEKDLEVAGYDTIPPETVLQCVAAAVCGSIRRQDILKISRDEFVDAWEETKDGLFRAVDYLRSHVGVVVSRILPYNALLIPITWFFVRRGDHDVSQAENALLRQYFYWAALSNRFNSGAGTKVLADLKKMQEILDGDKPSYDKHELNVLAEDLMWTPFSVGDAFCKAIVCLLSERGPRRFNTNGKVRLDNNWLKIANSKNYHHFFPRAFLKNRDDYSWASNSIMNIVLVDDHLNKRVIGAKPPSQYMEKFLSENKKLSKTLKTHYIRLDGWGVFKDDYERFISKRAGAIADALNKVLNPEIE